jgi:hypothetical protein
MQRERRFKHLPVHLIGLLFIIVLLFASAGCDEALDNIGDRPEDTEVPGEFRTATPGGRISVWLVTPTGEAGQVVQNVNSNETRGAVVGPAASATALVGTLTAATQTAAAPANVPNFQPDECPLASGRIPEPRPDTFAQFPAAIGTYLSDGGPTAVLEGELRNWGAITEQGGFVQDDTDLTGDGVPEIIVNIFNPFSYNPVAILNAGQLLVYGCDNNAYRLLYQTQTSSGTALPVVHRVGDMNGDIKSELVFDLQSCTGTSCTRDGEVLTWNPITGVLEPINNSPITSINGRIGVVDIDSDGILELTVTSSPTGDAASGPTRSVIEIWDWTGRNYVLAAREQDAPRYRVHMLHDADEAFSQQNWTTASAGYNAVRDDEELLAWPVVPNEQPVLRAYATYRLMLVSARRGRTGNAEGYLNTLVVENPDGTPGAVYREIGQAFLDTFRESGSSSTACQAALAVASSRPEALSTLNSYGYANRFYNLVDLCPF